MNFLVVVISLLGIVGINECWGDPDLTEEEMTAVATYFSKVLLAYDNLFTKMGLTTNTLQNTYDKNVKTLLTKIKKNEEPQPQEAFKTLTISSFEQFVNTFKNARPDNVLSDNDKQHIALSFGVLCTAMKKNERLQGVVFRDELQRIYVKEVGGTEKTFNRIC